ncbi:hypothetical protein LJC11_01520 [Bacteroidales bacterium OttesenSCG-928-I21]|nr:hypothetical protein [Bacteroidales bacterium OttesenSCG-928-I21]
MKKLIILLSVVALVFGLVSCGGGNLAIKKTEEAMKLMEKISTEVVKIAEDKVIDDGEAKIINEVFAKFTELSKSIDDMELTDEEKAALDEFEKNNSEKMEKIAEDFQNSVVKLFDCEGIDKINLN